MLAKKTSKNQLTLPKEVVKQFPDAEYFDVRVEKEGILLVPVKMVPSTAGLDAVRDKLARLGLTDGDVGKAVRWARRKNKA